MPRSDWLRSRISPVGSCPAAERGEGCEVETARLTPSSLRAIVADAATRELFVLGAHLAGRVMQALADDQVLLAFGDRRVVAESCVPLSAGREIAVEVTRTDGTIELRLETPILPGADASAQNYDLASLLNALADRATRGADPAVALEALRALAGERTDTVSGGAADAFARLLAPLELPSGRGMAWGRPGRRRQPTSSAGRSSSPTGG